MYLKMQPENIDSVSHTETNPTASQENNAAIEIERLLNGAKVQLPQTIAAKKLDDIPEKLKIYLNSETSEIKVESLNFVDKSQGYRMEFNLGYPLFSSLNYFGKIFNDNKIKKLYAGFGKYGGVLYGVDNQDYAILTFSQINDNNTKIQINLYEAQ